MRKLALLTLAAIAVGCSGSPTEPGDDADHAAATPSQLRAFDDLESQTQKRWVWIQHEQLGTPSHLSAPRVGVVTLAKGADPVKVTLGVLDANKKLFKMRDPSVELTPTKTETDDLGMTHARFQQLTHGIPVVGAELSAHYDGDGHVASIDANYVADLADVDVQPAFAAAEAIETVKAELAVGMSRHDGTPMSAGDLVASEGKLVVVAPRASWSPTAGDAKAARLAYRYDVRALDAKEPAIWVTTVDAKTGAILERYNNLQTVEGTGKGVLGDAKKFTVVASGTGYAMVNGAAGPQVRTYTAKQAQVVPGQTVSSADQNSWDTGVPGAGAAVDAHYNAEAVLKYYKEHFQRNAIDGTGGPLLSTVHFGEAYDNAAWTGDGMIYGDGGGSFRALSVGLDVVAHEFTHGVTEKSSNLEYVSQSGALNEAVSDIFAAFIEHTFAPDDTKNWSIGEQVVRTGPPLRNFKTPGAVDQPQPSHMSKYFNTQQDNGGVHINSGIINNAAWLMTVGGANPTSKVEVKYGIGWEKSEKLWYQANTKYFMSTTNFAQAVAGLLSAAKDIKLTTNEIAIVECAFKATGLATGACAAVVDPKAVSPTAQTGDPASGTAGPKPGTTASGDEAASDDGDDGETTSGTTAPKTRRRRVVTESNGCNAGASAPSPAPLGLAGLVLGLAALRRRRAT